MPCTLSAKLHVRQSTAVVRAVPLHLLLHCGTGCLGRPDQKCFSSAARQPIAGGQSVVEQQAAELWLEQLLLGLACGVQVRPSSVLLSDWHNKLT
jgi:hypothetical protein